MDPEGIMLSKTSQKRQAIISLTCGIFKKTKQNKTVQREQTGGFQRQGADGWGNGRKGSKHGNVQL